MSMKRFYSSDKWNVGVNPQLLVFIYFFQQEMILPIDKFADTQVWANSVDPDQTSIYTILPLRLHLLDTFLYGNPTTFFKFLV